MCVCVCGCAGRAGDAERQLTDGSIWREERRGESCRDGDKTEAESRRSGNGHLNI